MDMEIRYTSDKMRDGRVVVTMHMIECRQCDWKSKLVSDSDFPEISDAQTDHSKKAGHRQFWHYTLQRGQSRLMWLPDISTRKSD